MIVIYYRFAAAVRPLVDLFSRKGNRLLQSCQCRRSAASEPQKSSSPSVERIFPHQPCQIVSATFWRQKNKSQRSQTGRKKGKKERLNYELQQIEIIGSERGSHRNGNENPSSRQAGHCGRKRNFIPIFWFRGYQRSVEYRYGQAHRWWYARTDTKIAGVNQCLPSFHRTHATQCHRGYQSICTDSILHS